MTIAQTLKAASTALSASSDSPHLDAELLLSFILKQARTYLRAHPEVVLTESEATAFAAVLARRLKREPIAYITGHQEFWSLDLCVTPGTLVPRPETELLVELSLELFPEKNTRIKAADLGTGSGAIALALASERPSWEVAAVDASEVALGVASNNAQRLGLDRISFYCGNWFTALPAGEWDLVVTNPPYLSATEWPDYAAGLAFEPSSALIAGEDGLRDIREICAKAGQYIRRGGYLMIEHGFAQGRAVRELLIAAGCAKVRTVQDLAGQERVSMGQF